MSGSSLRFTASRQIKWTTQIWARRLKHYQKVKGILSYCCLCVEVNGTDFIQNILQVFHPCNLSKRHFIPFCSPFFSGKFCSLNVTVSWWLAPKVSKVLNPWNMQQHHQKQIANGMEWRPSSNYCGKLWKVGNGIEILFFEVSQLFLGLLTLLHSDG